MRVFKPTYSKPLPEGAKILRRKDGKVAKFTDHRGEPTEAPLTKKGKKILLRTSHWHIEFEDNQGIHRHLKAYSDEDYGSSAKQATERLAGKIQDLLNYKANSMPLTDELQKWTKELPAEIRERLVEFGLLGGRRTAAGYSLQELIDEFEKSMQAQERSSRHVCETVTMIRSLFKDCEFKHYSDISANKIEEHLKELRTGPRQLSYRRSNGYLKAAKQFCNWLIKRGYTHESPLQPLKALNCQLDRRRERRALSVDELKQLLYTTANAEENFGMSGHERALLYQFAIETGLRANEIRNLRKADFDFDQCNVTVRATTTKGKRQDVQYFTRGLCYYLKAFLQSKMPEAKAFGGRFKRLTGKTSDMLKRDLGRAEIPYIDESGRVFDFHALRGECATLLVASGVDPKTAQTIMRHRDINLTMNYYTHTLRGQEAQAIASLPDLLAPGKEAQQATGTDGRDEILRKSCFPGGQSVQQRTITDRPTNEGTSETPLSTRPAGLEPATFGFEVRDNQHSRGKKDGFSKNLAPSFFSDSEIDPDLQLIIQHWPELSVETKQILVKIVQTS
jgi:integrase